MMCELAKLVTLIVERAPVGVPRSVAPSVSHESSITGRPWRAAISAMRSQSGAFPMRLGNSSAPVRSVIISSIRSTSTQYVSGSQSTNTGTQPPRTIGATSVENVSAHVTTSAPGWRPSSSSARYSADEPELHMTPCALPKRAATSRSMRTTRRPGHSPCGPERSTSTTASISRSSWTLLE